MKYELNLFSAESIILLITINDYDTFLPLPTLWLLYCAQKVLPRNIYSPVSNRAKLLPALAAGEGPWCWGGLCHKQEQLQGAEKEELTGMELREGWLKSVL